MLVIPAGHWAFAGGQKGSAGVQTFHCDFRSPSWVNQSSSALTGERLEHVGCFSANRLSWGVCGQSSLCRHGL